MRLGERIALRKKREAEGAAAIGERLHDLTHEDRLVVFRISQELKGWELKTVGENLEATKDPGTRGELHRAARRVARVRGTGPLTAKAEQYLPDDEPVIGKPREHKLRLSIRISLARVMPSSGADAKPESLRLHH